MHQSFTRRLLSRSEVVSLLQVSDTGFQRLVDTGQITQLLICEEHRYDSRDVVSLIETYKRVAQRKTHESSQTI
jgi:hypothetical protein